MEGSFVRRWYSVPLAEVAKAAIATMASIKTAGTRAIAAG